MNTELNDLFCQVAGFAPDSAEEICGSASNRRYVRLGGGGESYIGVEGCDVRENAAFAEISRVFSSKGIPVPRVLAVSGDGLSYIQEDLGQVMLSDLVSDAHRKRRSAAGSFVDGGFVDGRPSAGGSAAGSFGDASFADGGFADLKPLLEECMRDLARIQFEGGAGLDFETCCPSPEFDRRMILFDLNYFKYCLLKPSGIEFDENILQDEFEKFAADLLSCRDYGRTFMYRDFQSRNVMISGGKPYYIDFQGGRRGPVYYDLVSFVWQVRAAYPEDVKDMLVETYLEALGRYVPDVDRGLFFRELRLFRLLRLLQVLGAYGFRGLVEHKAGFVTSLLPALEDLKAFISVPFDEYPYLSGLLLELVSLPRYASAKSGFEGLEVKVYSFSFKKGIPEDYTGNGGGYVFDCRSIHNPGKYERYRKLTGMDAPVIEFLEDDGEILAFLGHAEAVVDPHVETFLRRGFTNLSVSFGCTGGQHRSVYCAEHMAAHLAEKYPRIRVRLIHREQNVDRYL